MEIIQSSIADTHKKIWEKEFGKLSNSTTEDDCKQRPFEEREELRSLEIGTMRERIAKSRCSEEYTQISESIFDTDEDFLESFIKIEEGEAHGKDYEDHKEEPDFFSPFEIMRSEAIGLQEAIDTDESSEHISKNSDLFRREKVEPISSDRDNTVIE